MKSNRLVSSVYFLVRPYGRKKLGLVIAFSLLQAVLQVIGVTSVFPFFSIAIDPLKFRESNVGVPMLNWLPDMTNSELLLVSGVLSLFVLLLSSIVNISTGFVRARYTNGFAHWLRVKLIQQITAQPYAYFLQNEPAIMNKKVNSDVSVLANGVLLSMLEILAGILTISLLFVSILAINFIASLSALLIIGVFYTVTFRALAGRRKTIKTELKEANRQTSSTALHLFNGIKTIKVYGAEAHYTSRYTFHSRKISIMNSRLPIFVSIPKNLIEPIIFGSLIFYVFLNNGESGGLTESIPVLSVIALAGYRMIPAVQMLYARFSQISTMKHTLEEVFDEIVFIEEYESVSEEKLDSAAPINFSINTVELRDVFFSYPETNRTILRGVNLDISRGDAVAITGESGAGKSTLIDLILGLYQPVYGQILVNGRALDAERTRFFQSKIGYVQQDCFLSSDSIRRNIAFGISDEDIDEALLEDVCNMAQIHEFIADEMEQGFETMVGERGVKLSGGQRQRVAMARALYRKPEILILDEATSALDDETESLVTDAIDSLRGRVTLVVVAHRSNTIRKIPRKYVLVDGELLLKSHE